MTLVAVCWSGGKDSALVLDALRRSGEFQPAALLTTFTSGVDRVSMHGVRRELIQAQADALGLPLREAFITPGANNAEYEEAMTSVLLQLRGEGVFHVAFGDLFLADIRGYRERLLEPLGMTPVFPLWLRDTGQLAVEFVSLGFKAKLCCVDSRQISAAFAGRDFDQSLLRELPATADPCGENGEFHSFVYDGPSFRRAINVAVGEERRDDPFVFRDLFPMSLDVPS